MINEKFIEVLTSLPDSACAIVTQGVNEPHVVNSWNSYIQVLGKDKLLIPVGGMKGVEKNIERDNKIKLTIANREVMGTMYKGAGFLVKGTAEFIEEGSEFDGIKSKYPWARAVLVITITELNQTL